VHVVAARQHHPVVRRGSAAAVAVVAVAAVAAAALTGCTATVAGHGTSATTDRPGSSGNSASPQPATFTDCTRLFNLDALNLPDGRRDRLAFSCARIQVPRDYQKPAGASLTLELVKVHDRNNHTSNALVVNPGGPGGSGFEAAVGLAAQVSDKVLAHFDLVGFDPRGVGLSTPISCVSDSEKDKLNAAAPDMLTAAGLAQAKQLAQTVASACNAKYGAALADFNTVQTARDMDRVRAAVANSRLNYLGFSYGTELGSVYAHLFPDHVRVAVLDGAVDPLTDDIVSFAQQLKGFEGAFDQFAAHCRTSASCKTLGNPRQVVYHLVQRANDNPLNSSGRGETRTATGSIVLTGVLSALYSRGDWDSLGQALLDAQHGDARGLFALADAYNQRNSDGHYTNISDSNTAISCNDSKPGPSDATIKATAIRWAKAYPMFGRWASASLFSCQVWQPKRTPPPRPSAATAKPVLVIGNLHDPATPYRGAQDLAKTMGHAVLLTWDGEGHTSYLQGSSCVDKYVDDYLVAGTAPPPNTTCRR
jgi:pimeloyl-ACP methyl ester carboxylesterase